MKARWIRITIAFVLSASLLITAFNLTFAVAKGLSDIEESWAAKTLNDWGGRGWLKSYSDGTFRPDADIAYADLLALVHQGLDLPASSSRDERPVSREEAAIIMADLLQLERVPGGGVSKFKDAEKLADASKEAIGALAAEGIVSGYPDGTFRPENYLTRAEAVVVVNNILNYVLNSRSVRYDLPGIYGPASGGKTLVGEAVVTASDVTLRNMIVLGTLKICVKGSAVKITIPEGTTIRHLELCSKATVAGQGIIERVTMQEGAQGTTFEQKPGSIEGPGAIAATPTQAPTPTAEPTAPPYRPSDKTPPVFAVGYPKWTALSETSAQVASKANESGRIYAVVIVKNAVAPSSAQVKKGQTHDGSAAISNAQGTFAGNVEMTLQLNGLTAGKEYDIYVVAEDLSGNLQAAPVKGRLKTNGVAPLIVVTDQVPNGKVGVDYAFAFEAEGGAEPRVFAIADAELPPGMSIDELGNLKGTPVKEGTYAFSLIVIDSLAKQTKKLFTLVIDPADPMVFLDDSVPNGKVGVSYEFGFKVDGGVDPKIIVIPDAMMPLGLTIGSDGVIKGVPVQEGTYPIEVKVIDRFTNIAKKTFTLVIDPVDPLVFITDSLPNGKARDAYQLTLEAKGGFGPLTYVNLNNSLPKGMSLSPNGSLTGMPFLIGTYQVTIRVMDSLTNYTDKIFLLVIDRADP